MTTDDTGYPSPTLDGHEIMTLHCVPPGPVVGAARRRLIDLRLNKGPGEPRRSEGGA